LARATSWGDGLAARSLVLPWMLGLRWARPQLQLDDVPRMQPTLRLAAKVAADEFFFATEILRGRVPLSGSEWRRGGEEIEAAVALFRRRGWLASPLDYHSGPPALKRTRQRSVWKGAIRHEEVSFDSGYAPHPGEPGRARWRSYTANRTAHARLLRHPGPQRPWVVCVPGYRMGHPLVDFTGFRARWLHEKLGLNVAIAVLPFHGPRRVGRRSGDGYLAGDFLDTVHAQAQAVWDLRRLVGWLRAQGAPSIAAYGLSLGGYTAALLAALEPDLDAVVAGIPASCFLGLARSNAPAGVLRVAERMGFPFDAIERLLGVVSPLTMAPQVPHARRFVFAGSADRLAPPDQALALWNHWQRPRIAWYAGSHVSFLVEPKVRRLLREALRPGPLSQPSAVDTRRN